MQNDWILDVLADLSAFAKTNDLGALAEQLDDTTLVAAAEIASLKERALAQANGNEFAVGTNIRNFGASTRA